MTDSHEPTSLIFETHSTSVDNEAGLASGWHDCPLSVTGETQARELGERYREIGRVLCSDLQRSYRTAEIAFAGRDVTIVRDRRLRECDYGEYTRYPADKLNEIRAQHLDCPFPAGESYVQAVQRSLDVIDELQAQTAGALLVVGHRVTFYAIEQEFRGVTLAEAIAAPWSWQPGWTYLPK